MSNLKLLLLKKLYTCFLWMGFNFSRLQKLLRGHSKLFASRSPWLPGTHLVGLGKMKGWVDLGTTQRFWTWDSWIGNPAPKPLCHCFFKLTHLLFVYQQTWLNFSNIRLEQHIHFFQNPFFIHPATWNATPLFEKLSKTKAIY